METLFSILYFVLASEGIGDFRDDMIYNGIFKQTFIVMLAVSFGVSALYYLVFNRGRFKMDRRWHWFLFMMFPVLIVGGIALYLIQSQSGSYVPADPESLGFIFSSAFWGGFFYFVGALLLRKLSTHARYTPF